MHIALVLHAHLPYVRHPEHTRSLEEAWLYEATWESYARLVSVLAKIDPAKGPALTVSLSPTLLEMFADPMLRARSRAHLDGLVALAERVSATPGGAAFEDALVHYRDVLAEAKATIDRAGGDLTRAFVALAESGRIELTTTTATHAYLPSLKTEASVRAQLRIGAKTFEARTSRTPSGLWLPECAFDPRLDAVLAAASVRFTVLDAHGLELARPRPPFDVYAPVVSESGVAYFAREPAAAEAVWSRVSGYPGNPVYREFHRDIGFDADESVLGEWLGPNGTRRVTGLKLHAIGDSTARPYDPAAAFAQARTDASKFVAGATERLARVRDQGVEDPILVASYDAELFGHWWHEGPAFIAEVLRLLAVSSEPRGTALGSYLDREPEMAVTMPAASSWGEGGFGDVWLGGDSARILRHVHRAEVRVLEVDAAVRDTLASEKRRHARLQCIRELMLLESSDWPFMIRTGHNAEYANARIRLHKSRVDRISALAMTEEWSDDDLRYLEQVEAHTPIFSAIDEDALAYVFDP